MEYPTRPARIIEAAIEEEANGCFIAMVGDEAVGTAYSHVWGSVGWVGPVEVLPHRQGSGVGKALMEACHAHLAVEGLPGLRRRDDERQRAEQTVLHRPRVPAGGVTVFAEKKLRPAGYFVGGIKELNASNLADSAGEIRKLSTAVFPGMDCNSEFRGALKHALGKAFLFRHDGITKGAALLMEAPLEGLHMVSIRLLLTDPNIPDRRAVFLVDGHVRTVGHLRRQ